METLAREGEALAPMPSCLRAAMTDKFRQFDAYQLAKYNTRKSRGKKRCRPKVKEVGLGLPSCVAVKVSVTLTTYGGSFSPLEVILKQ